MNSEGTSLLDYSRFGSTTIDTAIMRQSHVVLVGCGGGRLTAELLARSAIGKMTFIDPDRVDRHRNPLTQGHFWSEHDLPKSEVTARACKDIQPNLIINPIIGRWSDALLNNAAEIRSANMLLACTDSYEANRSIRKFGIDHGIDVIEGWIWPSGSCVEHVVTFKEIIAAGNGCATCHLRPRHLAHENGFTNVEVDAYSIPSALSCVQMAYMTISRLHYNAGSPLAIARAVEQLLLHPVQFTRLDPGLTEPFFDTPHDHQLMATKSFGKDWPEDWVCPDCGGGKVPSSQFGKTS